MKIRRRLPKSHHASLLAIAAGLSFSARAETALIDFGNASSFRGASQTGADANGLYWTSVWSGAYYSSIVDPSNTATTLGFGFSASTGLATDSYNGPSGATSTPITQPQIDAANINAAALGILGGSKAAAFDYYSATDGRFVVQGLNANQTYNLTFFGSKKFTSGTSTTDYGVYTDSTYATAVGSTSLSVGVLGSGTNNTSNTATIAGLAPQTGNTLYVRFGASGYTATGYINAMSVVGYVPYLNGATHTLGSAKSYPGNTILGNGTTVNANVAGALGGGTSALQVDAGGGNLSLGAGQTVLSLIGAGNVALNTGASTLTINTGGNTTFAVNTLSNGAYAGNDYTGVLSGSGVISKTGGGSQTLSGANTFNGTVQTSAGTLILGNVNALQNAKLDTLYGASGTIAFGLAGNNTYKLGGLFGNKAIALGGNSLNISTANGSTFYDGDLTGAGSLIKSGTDTLTLRGNNTFTGSVTISAGTLQISDDGPSGGGSIASSSGITNNGLLAYNLTVNNRTYANVIGGTGSVSKLGTGTVLTLSGDNSYTGATTVSAGTLLVNGNQSAATGAVTVSSGALLGGNGTLGGATTLNNATIGTSGDTLALSSNLTTNGASTLASGATVNVAGTTNVATGTFTVNGTLGGSGSLTVASGATLAGNATLGGATTVSGGTLGGTGGVLSLGSTLTATSGSIVSGATVNVAGTTTFSSGSFTVDGTLGGAGVKTVAIGATLMGHGTIAGDATINGTLAPGNSPGVLTFADNVTLAGTTLMEINGTTRGTDYDGIDMTGGGGKTLTYGGALSLAFNAPVAAGVYDLFSLGAVAHSGDFSSVGAAGTGVSSFSGLAVTAGVGWSATLVDTQLTPAIWSLSFSNTTGDLTIAAIPEPSAYAVIAGFGALCLALKRRRRTI